MSTKEYQITVSPPFGGKDAEVFLFDGVECPSCGGTREVSVHEDYLQLGEPIVDVCQRCGGTGKLRAKVVVKWEADTAVIE